MTGTGLEGGGARVNMAGRGGKGSGGGAGEGAGEGGVGDVSATGGTSGSGATGDTGGSGGVNVMGAPVVHVTSPAPVTDPNDPGVIVADEIDVLCTATKSTDKGAKSVDQATVLLELLDGDGLVVETHPGTPTDNEDEYTAHFITRKVSINGGMGIECQASDTSSPPIMGTDRIDTFVDHGPSITPVDPPVGDADNPPFATAVGQALHVAFKVAAAPVVPKGDDGAAIGDVSLTVGGKSFDLTKSNGQYTATVHLDDPKIFMPTPDGDQKIVITAENQRSPRPALAEVAYDFIVDGTGPDIAILSPASADIVSGRVQLVFKVTDSQSGVDESSITAVINTKPYAFSADDPSWSVDVANSTYTFSFDTTQIQKSVGQVTLKVKASDLVGNESDTEDVLPHLDNVPPFVDLDPPPVREAHDDGTCSLAFDPLGSRAVNDLDVVSEFVTFRGLVWDDTNHAIGDNYAPAATVDLDSVVLFLQPNPAQGLLKDTTGDGVCDEIETQDSTSGEDLPAIKLLPVPTVGNSWFGSAMDESPSWAAAYPMPDICKYSNGQAPSALCDAHASDLTRVIHWTIYPAVPAVFGVPPLQGVTCTGYGWEIKPFVSNGWICAALRARDNAGNVGVSAPIRLCYDDGTGTPPDCQGSNPSEPPSCIIDSCRLPDRFASQLLRP